MNIPLGANDINVNICSICRLEGTNIDGPNGEFIFCWGCAPEKWINEAEEFKNPI